jgi:hypothetical protein
MLVLSDGVACWRGALDGWTLTLRPNAGAADPLELGQDGTWIK